MTSKKTDPAPETHLGTYKVPNFGTLWLRWNRRGLAALEFEKPNDSQTASALPEIYRDPLGAYFAGKEIDLGQLPVDLAGTDFQLRVWDALRKIPHGTVRTYQSIAIEVGSPRGMRAVGMANGRNPIPIVIPCHRVVRKGRLLGGYSGGIERKRFLLELEGVSFDVDTAHPRQLSLDT